MILRASSMRSALYAALTYGIVALAFTLIGVFFGPSDVQVGGVRPENTIPTHLAELAGFGLVLGLGSMMIYGRKGLHLVLLLPTLTVLLDIDHLPIYIGYAEPIRPAHSFVFILIALGITAITIKALDIELAMASAFMGHMAVDRGLFPPISPLNFQYVLVDPYRLAFGAFAVILALAAGIVLRLKSRDSGNV